MSEVWSLTLSFTHLQGCLVARNQNADGAMLIELNNYFMRGVGTMSIHNIISDLVLY